MVRRYKKPKSRKKPIIITGVVVVILLAGGFWWWQSHSKKPTQKYTKTSTGYDVNLNPPTDEEKEETEQNKEKLSQEQEKEENQPPQPQPESANKKTPFITFAGQEGQSIEVSGYVTGIFEDGGTCTATFTQNSRKITATSQGFKDADHTTCTPILVQRSQFPAGGTWSATLSYKSSQGSGTSEPRNVTIQ
jgi:cytoskeletal protein RodZ